MTPQPASLLAHETQPSRTRHDSFSHQQADQRSHATSSGSGKARDPDPDPDPLQVQRGEMRAVSKQSGDFPSAGDGHAQGTGKGQVETAGKGKARPGERMGVLDFVAELRGLVAGDVRREDGGDSY